MPDPRRRVSSALRALAAPRIVRFKAMQLPRAVLIGVALLLSGGVSRAGPSEPIGSAVTVINLVTAKLESDERHLAVGDDVRQQELIEVDRDGRGEIKLRDETKLALGPGSRLLLDKFVYDPQISGGAIVLNLVKGTFRFITGIAAKPAYVIRTPAASITVRGTIFDLYVQNADATWLLLIEGAVEVCTESGKCLVHDEPGKLIRITSDAVGKPVKWTGLSGKQDIAFESAFPFVVSPPDVDPKPIFTRDQIVLGTFPEPGGDKPKHVDDDDDGGKSKGGKGSKKVTTHDNGDDYTRETRHRRRDKSDEAEIINKGIGIGIGIGIGLGHHKGGGDYPHSGGEHNRFNR